MPKPRAGHGCCALAKDRSAAAGVTSCKRGAPGGHGPRAQHGCAPMQNPLPGKDPRPRSLAARLERAAGDMNAFLLVLAIGLATLDLTCLWAFKLQDALPAMTRPSASTKERWNWRAAMPRWR